MPLLRSSNGVSVFTSAGVSLPLIQVLGIGRNYADHAKEMGGGGSAPEAPMVFTKNAAAACLNGDEIVVPAICQDREQVDYEGELAVVIGHGPGGTPCRDVARADALGHVLGYCCANDVSARWWQKTGSGGQFFRGKSFDTFCPLGPWVVSAAEVGDPGRLSINTRVNGEVRQNSSTAEMIFDVASLICELSRGMTLLPGTVILTGTPSGVGAGRNPPQFLKHGDVVEVSIEMLGTLTNRVAFAGK